ncbi:MAG: hypothetical protein HY235_14955 [Acidobacteria bacterium]|nr:hypothetical protein [Acidobacteriota bacterium]
MAFWRWLIRMFSWGLGEGVHAQPTPQVSTNQAAAKSAAGVLQCILTLKKNNADWATIWQTLNPDGDVETQRLLVELRGPHMFVPHVALNVLELGCKRVLQFDPRASRVAALRSAIQESDPFVR